MEALPKYKQIAKSLIEKIKKGEYKKNSFLPSENQLTKIYKCSRITVRQALAILIKKELIKSIPGVGSVVIGEPSNVNVKEEDIVFHKSIKNIYIILVFPSKVKWGIENPFYAEIIGAVEEKVRKKGYHLSFTVYENIKRVSDLSQLIINKHVNGFILLGDIEEKIIELIKKSGLPVISINNPLCERYNIPIVINDDFRGGYEVAKFLLEIGSKKIACIKGPKDSPSCEVRYEGFVTGLKNLGFNAENLVTIEGNLEFESGYDGMKKIFSSSQKELPDSIFCINDLMAIGAMKYISEQGLKIPDNINVIGFDNIAQSSQVVPPLTTVDIQRKEMGYIAAEKLIEFIENNNKYYPIKIVLPCKLVIRNSTQKKKK